LAGGPVGAGEDVWAEADLGAHVVAGEIEDPVDGDLVAVEHPREQSFDPNREAGGFRPHLRRRSCRAS